MMGATAKVGLPKGSPSIMPQGRRSTRAGGPAHPSASNQACPVLPSCCCRSHLPAAHLAVRSLRLPVAPLIQAPAGCSLCFPPASAQAILDARDTAQDTAHGLLRQALLPRVCPGFRPEGASGLAVWDILPDTAQDTCPPGSRALCIGCLMMPRVVSYGQLECIN